MNALEIVLLTAGGVIFILSFFLPSKDEKKLTKDTGKLAQEEIKALVGQELETVKNHVDEVVDEAVGYAMEKTERSLERLSNEKIMAVNEYSDTVLAEIHKNHEEAMFLYDMLHNKHENLQSTVSEVNRTVKEAEETVSNFRNLTPERIEPEPETEEKIPVKSVRHMQTLQQEQPVEKEQKKAPEKPKQKAPGKQTGKVPVSADETDRVSFIKDADGSGKNSNERILELYKQGKSRVAIAKELGLGVGEVKLVIDLYKNQSREEEMN